MQYSCILIEYTEDFIVKSLAKLSKIGFILLFAGALLISSVGEIEAENTQPDIRIGVIPTTEALTIGSAASFIIKEKETGAVLLSSENENVSVSLASVANITTNFHFQVAWTTNKTYVDDWLHRAEMAGYPTYIEDHLNGCRLLIGEFPADASWPIRNTFRNEVIANGLAQTDSFWRS